MSHNGQEVVLLVGDQSDVYASRSLSIRNSVGDLIIKRIHSSKTIMLEESGRSRELTKFFVNRYFRGLDLTSTRYFSLRR